MAPDVIDGAGAIVNDKATDAVAPALSVICTRPELLIVTEIAVVGTVMPPPTW